MSVFRSRFELELDIEGTRYEVVQHNSEWAINSIPSAVCLLAVGREARSGSRPAKVHSAGLNFQKLAKAKVYYKAEGEYDANHEWPDEENVIFDGRIVGIGYQLFNGKLHLAVHLEHWIGDLNFGSALGAQNHVLNPMDYRFASITGFTPISGLNQREPSGISSTTAGRDIVNSNLSADLWAQTLKPLLCGLASQSQFRFSGTAMQCFGLAENTINQDVLAALARIDGNVGDCKRKPECYTVPLAMDNVAGLPTEVTRAIASAIGRDAVESFVHTTIWGKLVGSYASNFMFSVIPLVDHAIVVPFTPLLNKTYCKEIDINDYDMVSLSGGINRPIRAVGVYAAMRGQSNLVNAADPGIFGVGGCFAPANPDPNGQVYLLRAPEWLDNVAVTGWSARRTTGLKDFTATNSATTPRAMTQSLVGSESGKKQPAMLAETVDLFNGYAHTIYATEVLRGRTGTLEGKLRFDIAPGSMVKINSFSDPFIENDKLSENIYAAITGVSITLNAEAAQASTSFRFEYYRTEKEFNDPNTSVDKHPMYTTIFKGAPLKAALEFGSCCVVPAAEPLSGQAIPVNPDTGHPSDSHQPRPSPI